LFAEATLPGPIRAGETLGHYRILEKIGSGGMGEVYRAQDEHLDREVAIKVLIPGTLADEHSRRHFRKEALTLSQLNHPNIATIHDFDTQQGVDFLAMEYIPGVTLSEKLATGPLSEKEIITLAIQFAEALSTAHEHGIVHSDLKPGNLRLTGDGRLKILDFGLAKLRFPMKATARTETFSQTQTVAGTLPYMAPEQLLGGQIDYRTDIHAAGAVLYEMATGQCAFSAPQSSQLIATILECQPRPCATLNPNLSPELDRIIGKCLEKEPENRYQSAKEMAIDLRRLQPSLLRGVQPPAARPTWSAKKWMGLSLAALVAVIVWLTTLNTGNWHGRVLGRVRPQPIQSLAVLPLANLSGNPQQEYFADG
jgi:eukaryotic-like serine/threonine-protein kinase